MQNLTVCLKRGSEAQCKFSFSFFIPLFLLHRCLSSLSPTFQQAGIPCTQVIFPSSLIHSALSKSDCTESKHMPLLTLQPLPLLVLLAQPARIKARSSFYLPIWYCNLIYCMADGSTEQRFDYPDQAAGLESKFQNSQPSRNALGQ